MDCFVHDEFITETLTEKSTSYIDSVLTIA